MPKSGVIPDDAARNDGIKHNAAPPEARLDERPARIAPLMPET
jgi:hypothetical protein